MSGERATKCPLACVPSICTLSCSKPAPGLGTGHCSCYSTQSSPAPLEWLSLNSRGVSYGEMGNGVTLEESSKGTKLQGGTRGKLRQLELWA